MNRVEFLPEEQRELDAVRSLHETAPERHVQLSYRQLSIGSTLPLSAIGSALDRAEKAGELKPMFPGSRVYRAGELSTWCAKHANETATRIGAALLASPRHEFADPAEAVNRYLKKLLAQSRE